MSQPVCSSRQHSCVEPVRLCVSDACVLVPPLAPAPLQMSRRRCGAALCRYHCGGAKASSQLSEEVGASQGISQLSVALGADLHLGSCLQRVGSTRLLQTGPLFALEKERKQRVFRSEFAVAVAVCPAAALPRAERVCSPAPLSPRGTCRGGCEPVVGRVCSGVTLCCSPMARGWAGRAAPAPHSIGSLELGGLQRRWESGRGESGCGDPRHPAAQGDAEAQRYTEVFTAPVPAPFSCWVLLLKAIVGPFCAGRRKKWFVLS